MNGIFENGFMAEFSPKMFGKERCFVVVVVVVAGEGIFWLNLCFDYVVVRLLRFEV